jgi:NTP pyrophosphatase (non-canonical NTP hydrolase)
MGLAEALLDLQELTRRLRRECPWDREQTARTIVPHTVEEAYEVADAAVSGDAAELRGELGDLLFQVYFSRFSSRRPGTVTSRRSRKRTRSSSVDIRTCSAGARRGPPSRTRALGS